MHKKTPNYKANVRIINQFMITFFIGTVFQSSRKKDVLSIFYSML